MLVTNNEGKPHLDLCFKYGNKPLNIYGNTAGDGMQMFLRGGGRFFFSSEKKAEITLSHGVNPVL